MNSGHADERIREKRTVMEDVCYVEKRMQRSMHDGGNTEYSTDTRIPVTYLMQIRHKEHHQPECFWNTGVVTSDWTTLPDSEHMIAEDV